MRDKLTLDVIEVPEPCEVPWESMRGDDRARFCRTCQHSVYDLSAVTRAEAEALLAEHGESLCAQFYRRADGTIQTADCAPERQAAARRAARRSLGVAASVLGATLTVAAGLAAALVRPAEPAPRALSRTLDKLAVRVAELEITAARPEPPPEHERRLVRGRVRHPRAPAPVPSPSPSSDSAR